MNKCQCIIHYSGLLLQNLLQRNFTRAQPQDGRLISFNHYYSTLVEQPISSILILVACGWEVLWRVVVADVSMYFNLLIVLFEGCECGNSALHSHSPILVLHVIGGEHLRKFAKALKRQCFCASLSKTDWPLRSLPPKRSSLQRKHWNHWSHHLWVTASFQNALDVFWKRFAAAWFSKIRTPISWIFCCTYLPNSFLQTLRSTEKQ